MRMRMRTDVNILVPRCACAEAAVKYPGSAGLDGACMGLSQCAGMGEVDIPAQRAHYYRPRPQSASTATLRGSLDAWDSKQLVRSVAFETSDSYPPWAAQSLWWEEGEHVQMET